LLESRDRITLAILVWLIARVAWAQAGLWLDLIPQPPSRNASCAVVDESHSTPQDAAALHRIHSTPQGAAAAVEGVEPHGAAGASEFEGGR
jgi:hypothetical protein